MKEQVFVIIVNFNGGKKTVMCVKSVKDWPLVVVDNGSTDGSIEEIKKLKFKMQNDKSKFKIILNKRNLGFAGGANRGIKYALKEGAEYIMLLNQDAVVEKGAIDKLINIMKKDKRIGICGPLILTPQDKIWSAGGVIDKKRYSGGHFFKILKKKPYEVDFISGCAICIKKEVFQKIGFFDERFFLYYEDVDFCYRAKRAGFKVVFVPQAIVSHEVSNREKEKIRQYYMARNHFLFLEKHAPLKIKIRETIRLPKTIYEHLRRGEGYALLGMRDFFLRRFGKAETMSFQAGPGIYKNHETLLHLYSS